MRMEWGPLDVAISGPKMTNVEAGSQATAGD